MSDVIKSAAVLAVIPMAAFCIIGVIASGANRQADIRHDQRLGTLQTMPLIQPTAPRLADTERSTGGKSRRYWHERAWGYFDAGRYRLINPGMAEDTVCPELRVGVASYDREPELTTAQLENWTRLSSTRVVMATFRVLSAEQLRNPASCPWVTVNSRHQLVMEGQVLARLVKLETLEDTGKPAAIPPEGLEEPEEDEAPATYTEGGRPARRP